MSDTRRMLAEMVDPLFAELGPAATSERDGNRLDELGLPALLVPEADGGFGGSWMDALTRRLWQWRSEFGNDAHWSGKLGARVIARGADAFWSDLTVRTD